MASEPKSSKESDAIDKMEAEIERVKQALDEALGKGESLLGDEVDELRERFEETTDEIESHIAAHPIRSALIALGIGLLLGRLLAR